MALGISPEIVAFFLLKSQVVVVVVVVAQVVRQARLAPVALLVEVAVEDANYSLLKIYLPQSQSQWAHKRQLPQVEQVLWALPEVVAIQLHLVHIWSVMVVEVEVEPELAMLAEVVAVAPQQAQILQLLPQLPVGQHLRIRPLLLVLQMLEVQEAVRPPQEGPQE
jgi:hypothetical protein